MEITSSETPAKQQVDWKATLGEQKGGTISSSGPLPLQVRAERLSHKGGFVGRALWGFSEVFLETAEVLGKAVVEAPSYITGSNRRRSNLSKDLVTVRDEVAGIFTGTGKTYETVDYVLRNPGTVAMALGGVVGSQIKTNPEKMVGEVAAMSVMSSKSVNEKLFDSVRKIPAFEPKVKVTRGTGRAGFIQSGDDAQLVLETTSKNVRLSKAPKGDRYSNLQFSGEGLLVENVGSATVPVTANLRVGKGGAKVSNVKVGGVKDYNIGYVPEVNLIDETIGVSKKQVKVKANNRLLIRDAEKILDGKVYPSVITKDVKVADSVRTVSTPVVVKPSPVDKLFSSNAIVIGELEKPVKAAKSVVGKSNKAYSGFVGIAEDGVFSVRRKGINFDDFYNDISEANKAVKNLEKGFTGTNTLKTEKVVKTATKKAQKPVISVEKVKSDYQGINFGVLEQINIPKNDFKRENKNVREPILNINNRQDLSTELKPKITPITNNKNLFDTTQKRTPAKILIAPPKIDNSYEAKITPIINIKEIITNETIIKTPTKPITQRPIKPKNKPKRLILPSLSMKPQTDVANGFSVFVRKKGVFKLFGSQLKEEQAIALGKTVVRDTSAATFRVPGLTKKDFQEQDFYFGGKGMFIQKRNKRISSAGEIKDISRKGQASIKRKKNKRGLLSGFW